MSAIPDLEFRPLEGGEGELVAELAETAGDWDSVRVERFGLTGGIPPAPPHRVWGLFIRGSLCGAAWYSPQSEGVARVAALLVSRNWWRTGVAAWMLEKLAWWSAQEGAGSIVATVAKEEAAAGEILEDAGFSGPDPEDEEYPAGEWRRPAFLGGQAFIKGG